MYCHVPAALVSRSKNRHPLGGMVRAMPLVYSIALTYFNQTAASQPLAGSCEKWRPDYD